MVAVGGVTGVTFLLAVIAQLGLLAVQDRRRRVQGIAAALAVVAAGGSLKLLPQETPEQQVTVGVVQGNVNRYLHGSSYYAQSVTDNVLSETILLLASNRAAGESPLDFVLWPENATDVDPLVEADTRRLVEAAVALADVPIFVGAEMNGPEPETTRQTAGIWWHPDTGPGDRYNKRNLVPFGEYIPFRDFLLPRLPVLQQIGRQSIRGTEPGVVAAPTATYADLQVGDIICFELAWDDTVYDTVLGGADIIVSQSNTNTYGGTFEVPKQLVLNRIRAMELRREVVVSTLNSVSGLVDATGTFLESTEEFTAGNRTFTIPLRTNIMPAVFLGPWLGWALALLGLSAALFSGARVPRSRHGNESTPADSGSESPMKA